ncbi:hypothetical protein CHS0354_007984 [Potamilus streckersoni]|uniref:DDE Tnp4 domain-containing protein n=1 Tax=Potamilus streckersoni TaxID=2493646 RepID=A0AAE0VT32_9BIVA|nr:hypothetical protein CHS0354_007984 [Potamilus streckersoni]
MAALNDAKGLFQFVKKFADAMVRKDGGRDTVSLANQLLVFLCHISNFESVRDTANLFGISPSTAQGCIHSVAKVFKDGANKFIKWPDHDRCQEIVTPFCDVSGIPDVAGKFPLYEKEENHHILRQEFLDSAYPLKIWLQTPFRDNDHLTAQQRRYNRALSGIIHTVEMTIGHLKGRFMRLTALHCADVATVCNFVMAACDILVFINMEEAEDTNQYHYISQNEVIGEQSRNQLLNLLKSGPYI